MFNLADVLDLVTERVGAREAVVFRDRRLSYDDFAARTNQLAHVLHDLGLGCHHERGQLADWQAGQDRLAIYLYNGNEFLEAMFGAFKARLAPFNVNFRYVDEELVHLLNNAGTRVIVYHRCFAPRLAAVRHRVPTLQYFIEVNDGTPEGLGEGLADALPYEAALSAAPAGPLHLPRTADDLYVLYTGGTTGLPKGVLWRQGDVFVSVLGGRRPKDGSVIEDGEELAARAEKGGTRILPAPPFMHAAGQWIALNGLCAGNTLVIQDSVQRFDAADVLGTIAAEKINLLSLVGDAFARPLLDAIHAGSFDLSSLKVMLNSGAPLNVTSKDALLAAVPDLRVLDVLGSTEGGNHGQHFSAPGTAATGTFKPSPGNAVLDDDRRSLLAPGHEGIGWWARRRHIPLGYLDDEAATKETFVTIGGERFSIPGDRARLLANGDVELLGRDSLTINSGGEKIFVEEVENALKRHLSIHDALVVGRANERWGQEVVAVVQLKEGAVADEAGILAEAARHVARYKLPKAFVFMDKLERNPSGKPDYAWARELL
ncbi:MAG: acyl-CoA synthetase [Alphaproteobacteria bacterium]|nr:acyl-CoA synthetase [Alphaproteobacteria bacterium]